MTRNWMRMLLATLLGNLVYFSLSPFLPDALTHNLYTFDPGLLLDLAFCIGIYAVLRKLAKPTP